MPTIDTVVLARKGVRYPAYLDLNESIAKGLFARRRATMEKLGILIAAVSFEKVHIYPTKAKEKLVYEERDREIGLIEKTIY